MADDNPTPLNVPSAQPLSPTPAAVMPTLPAGVSTPAQVATQVETPQEPTTTSGAQTAEPTLATGIEAVQSAPTGVAGLTGEADVTSPIGQAGLVHEPPASATPINITPPTATQGLSTTESGSPVGAPGLAHTVEANPVQIGVPATPGIISSTTPVPVPAPTLATAAPVQAPAAPRIAGSQLVPPAPPATQTASQLSQPANEPQTLNPISTMAPA